MSIASQLNAIQSPSIAALLSSSKSGTTGQAGEGVQSFWEQLSVKVSATESVESQPQSLDEYKQKIAAAISAMPIHPSQANARQSVSIHDNAFEKMMNDPELEGKILGELQESFAADFSPCDPAYCHISYDAEGQYNGWSAGSFWGDEYETKSADAFWKKDGDNAAEKAVDKRREERQLLDELLEKRQARLEDMRASFFEKAMGSSFGTSGAGSGQGGTLASGLTSFFG